VFAPAVGVYTRRRRWLWRFLLALVPLAMLTASASAELTQRGDLFVRFDGGISPKALPRQALAPIGMRIEGAVKVPSGGEPPSLRRMRIAINRAGHLDTHGLPLCQRQRLEQATSTEALATCDAALVGAGGIVARTSLPDQPATTVRSDVLLFNGRDHGRPAILAHIYQTQPTPRAWIVVFEIHRQGGTFGTVITGQLPPEMSHDGRLKSIFLQLERRYVFHGYPRSYLSAACSAPAGFTAATFPFARASMIFDDGRTLSSTLVRSCRVK
jgi:hypothetical protein